jgi:uncharacterized repeat protein (TIGR01451 family)
MSISFQPTGTGTRSGTLTVTCDAAECPLSGSVTGNGINPSASISPTSVGFPDTLVGSTSQSPVLLFVCDSANPGTTNLVVSAISVGGANPGDFGYGLSGQTLPVTVTPGDCLTVYPAFSPSAVGPRSATLTVTTNDALHTLSTALSGNGIYPSGSVSPTSVGFPDTYGGSSSASVPVVVTNSGTADLVVSAITLVGTNPGDFSASFSGTLPVTVHPGSSLTVNTTFAPSAAGERSATLSFATNDALHTLSVTLGGNGLLTADLGVTLGASPNPVRTGTHLTYSITVTNGGPGDSNGVTLSDTLPSGTTFYSVSTTQGSCSAPAVGHTGTVTCTVSSLPNGSSFTVTLVVTPTIRSGTLADAASVSAGTPDPNSANNTASVTTTVSRH